jgi:hypothetical protein
MPSCRILVVPFVATVFTVLMPVSPAAGAVSPRDELLRLVPGDAGYCLIIGDLRDHTAKILDSSWWKALRESPLGRAVANSAEMRKLDKVLGSDLRRHLQIDWPRLRDDILGDAVAFAYRPGRPGKPAEEQGLFLLWARDPVLLGTLITRLNQVQQQAGELSAVNPYHYNGRKFYERIEQKVAFISSNQSGFPQILLVGVPVPMLIAQEQYYYVDGPLLAFSTRKEVLLRVLDVYAARGEGDKLSVLSGQMRRAGADKALVALWMNPRIIDAQLQERAARTSPMEAWGLRTFFRYWQALDALVLSLHLEKDLELRLALQARPEALPPAGRRFLAEAATPSELWNRFPASAILTIAGRTDAAALAESLGDFLPPEARNAIGTGLQRSLGSAMGMNLAQDLLPQLGPDWGVCVFAPSDRSRFPQVLAALRVQPGMKDTPVDRTLLQATQFFVGLAVFDLNAKHGEQIRVKTAMQDAVEVKYLANSRSLPAEVQPALALKQGYLLASSSPDAIRRFGAATATVAPTGTDVPILRLSFVELGNFLQDRREAILDLARSQGQGSRESAGHRFDDVVTVLRLFDRLELTKRAVGGQLTLTARVKPASAILDVGRGSGK